MGELLCLPHLHVVAEYLWAIFGRSCVVEFISVGTPLWRIAVGVLQRLAVEVDGNRAFLSLQVGSAYVVGQLSLDGNNWTNGCFQSISIWNGESAFLGMSGCDAERRQQCGEYKGLFLHNLVFCFLFLFHSVGILTKLRCV